MKKYVNYLLLIVITVYSCKNVNDNEEIKNEKQKDTIGVTQEDTVEVDFSRFDDEFNIIVNSLPQLAGDFYKLDISGFCLIDTVKYANQSNSFSCIFKEEYKEDGEYHIITIGNESYFWKFKRGNKFNLCGDSQQDIKVQIYSPVNINDATDVCIIELYINGEKTKNFAYVFFLNEDNKIDMKKIEIIYDPCETKSTICTVTFKEIAISNKEILIPN